jgi:hypothetical protein
MPSLVISQSNFPYVSSGGVALEWGHGQLYNAVLGSSVVRVGSRGVRWCQTCSLSDAPDARLEQANDFNDLNQLNRAQAGVLACKPVLGALCAAEASNASVRLFPVSQASVAAESFRFRDARLAALANAGAGACASSESARAIIFNASGYDVSLCDLVHGSVEIAFYPQTGMLSWRKRDASAFFESTLWRALVTVTVLYLFARVCGNISGIIRRTPRAGDWHLVLAMLLALGCTFWATAHNDFAREEQILTVVLQAYASLCCALMLGEGAVARYAQHARHLSYTPLAAEELQHADYADCTETLLRPPRSKASEASVNASVNTTGALIAVLLLLTAHLHDTYETPFMSIFVIIFTARSFLKFLNVVLVHSRSAGHGLLGLNALWKLPLLAADTAVLVCVLELGARSGARSAAEYPAAAAGLLLVGALGGVFLFKVVEAG